MAYVDAIGLYGNEAVGNVSYMRRLQEQEGQDSTHVCSLTGLGILSSSFAAVVGRSIRYVKESKMKMMAVSVIRTVLRCKMFGIELSNAGPETFSGARTLWRGIGSSKQGS